MVEWTNESFQMRMQIQFSGQTESFVRQFQKLQRNNLKLFIIQKELFCQFLVKVILLIFLLLKLGSYSILKFSEDKLSI